MSASSFPARSFPQRVLASPVGELIARSWIEKPVLFALEHWFFPLSRLWAAARSAEEDIDRYFEAVPMRSRPFLRKRVQRALTLFSEKRHQIHDTEGQWRDLFFSTDTVSEAELQTMEARRKTHRNEYNLTRRQFARFIRYVDTSVYDSFAAPDELEQHYGLQNHQFELLFAPPAAMPVVETSHKIDSGNSRDFWIRFQSPSQRMGDIAYARVLEPLGVENPPTLIFGHGIGVEFDHWRNMVDIVKLIPQMGIRVIRPELPWHGRRVPDGYYGGEYFLSRSPLGAFDFFTAQHQEWSVLMDWARSTSQGVVGVGGSSLGAYCAQSYSIRSGNWDKRFQPQALFLMTHCAHIREVALDGALADIWGLAEPLRKLGWNRELEERWLDRLDPPGMPVVNPRHIVSVLGKSDVVTPFASGERQQQAWQIPEDQRFNWPCGHFSVPLHMVRHREPLERLRDIFQSQDTQKLETQRQETQRP